MAEQMIVRKMNVTKIIGNSVSKFKKGGVKLEMSGKPDIRLNGISFKGKVHKKVKNDMLLKKILLSKSKGEYDNLLKGIDSVIKHATNDLIPDQGDMISKKEYVSGISTAQKDIEKEIESFARKSEKIFQIEVLKYMKGRKEGKLEVDIIKTEKVTAMFGAVGSWVGVAGAGVGTVGTGGLAIPGLVVACWGSYQACKDAVDTLRHSHKSIHAIENSILNQISLLNIEYSNDQDSSKRKQKINRREIKAAAATIFLSVGTVKSLSKVNRNLDLLEQKSKILFYKAAKIGKRAGDHNKELLKLKATAVLFQKQVKTAEDDKILKKSKITSDMKDFQKEIKDQKAALKVLVDEAIGVYNAAKQYAPWIQKIRKEITILETDMPKTTKRGINTLKGVKLAVDYLAVAISLDFDKAVGGSIKAMAEITNTAGETLKAGHDAFSKEYSKLKKVPNY